jgi:hypothetical protein
MAATISTRVRRVRNTARAAAGSLGPWTADADLREVTLDDAAGVEDERGHESAPLADGTGSGYLTKPGRQRRREALSCLAWPWPRPARDWRRRQRSPRRPASIRRGRGGSPRGGAPEAELLDRVRVPRRDVTSAGSARGGPDRLPPGPGPPGPAGHVGGRRSRHTCPRRRKARGAGPPPGRRPERRRPAEGYGRGAQPGRPVPGS